MISKLTFLRIMYISYMDGNNFQFNVKPNKKTKIKIILKNKNKYK